MTTGIFAVIIIVVLVSFSGCFGKNDEPNPSNEWVSQSGHSDGIYFEIITDKDIYSVTDMVNISVKLHSTLDFNVTLTLSFNPGYWFHISDSQERYWTSQQGPQSDELIYYEVQPDSTVDFTNWSWNQTFTEDGFGYYGKPDFIKPADRNQEITITCKFYIFGNHSNGPEGWKTIWLK
jgi:hypothetical protein